MRRALKRVLVACGQRVPWSRCAITTIVSRHLRHYAIAKLAVDPSGLSWLTADVPHWDLIEQGLADVAETFDFEIDALRTHLNQQGDAGHDGVVPTVVMQHFVQWPME